MARDHRTIRQSRRTYKRRRCQYREPTGWRCRARPEQGQDYCTLHAEPAEEDGAIEDNVGRFKVWGPYTASAIGSAANHALISEWLLRHDINPQDVRAVGVFRNADDSARHLHATLMVRDEDGRRRVDCALGQVVTTPHVVPLLAPPPVLDGSARDGAEPAG